ncbi:hypothetical protein BGZ65_000311 [Modicella reniformis]|uniref:PPM-type phosphatase domain-containing protein n=1 Tax=Modicella reniformis TaxID=1440133 RepID=A0A9P6LU46_9FUNG|nr:hypothetical protein BGZ65_000311 [Modicella reniformis]
MDSTPPTDPVATKSLGQPQHSDHSKDTAQLDLDNPRDKESDSQKEASHQSTAVTGNSEVSTSATAFANTDQGTIAGQQPNGANHTQEPAASTPSSKRRRKPKTAPAPPSATATAIAPAPPSATTTTTETLITTATVPAIATAPATEPTTAPAKALATAPATEPQPTPQPAQQPESAPVPTSTPAQEASVLVSAASQGPEAASAPVSIPAASSSSTVSASRPGAPLPKLSSKAKLPKLSALHLFPEQLKHPLFVAIARVLVVYGNVWQSATELVGTFEPIEKYRLNGTTYYRMIPRALDPNPQNSAVDSDATESDSNDSGAQKGGVAGGSKNGRPAAPKAQSKAGKLTAKRKLKQQAVAVGEQGSKKIKKRAVSGWGSDTLSSDSSDDDSQKRSSNGRRRRQASSGSGSKRSREDSPSSSTSSTRPKTPARRNSIPTGLKKLPKGYVYDTEFNQAALMNLSVNPSQTGEYMRHLRGKSAQENNFPDRRGEYGVDLTQEPAMFALEQQTGYTYPRLRNSGRERLPKGDCEDGYAIADLKHNGSYLGRLFCITDGHGGRACSSFVIATIPGAMQVILGKYRPADLSLPNVQELVKAQITEAIRLIDKEYLDYKKQQYIHYKNKQIPNDPGSDGTTLIVNIFIDKWIICLNLGDSRTMMGNRDATGRWNVDFYSEDHTPSLERLAQTIYANGGEFVTHDDKVIRFDPNLKNDKKHRQSLKEARIRVKDAASNPYGIPHMTKNGHCASVNLGACIGDVLYKLDPINPVLSCKPDITFIDTTDIQQGFLLMASDGLWDYVQRGGKVQDQNTTVCQFVGDKIDRGWNHQRIVYTLSDRESSTGLYSDSIQEYDDFTAILVTFNKQQLFRQQQQQQEQEQKQILLHQQRLQEQKILLLQQQHQKQQEVERIQRIQPLEIQKDHSTEVERLRREQELLRKAKIEKGEDDTDSDLAEPERKRKMHGSEISLATAIIPPTATAASTAIAATTATTTITKTSTTSTTTASSATALEVAATETNPLPARKQSIQSEPPEIEMVDMKLEAGVVNTNGGIPATASTRT